MRSSLKNIFKVGVTCGIGSGKSTVCDFFERWNAPVLRSDDIAKQVSNSDPRIRSKLITLLGSDAYLPDGSLNRSWIASMIFRDGKLRQKVESIVHPIVEEERNRRIAELANQGNVLVIIESALIYEVGLDKQLDAVLLIDAKEELRIKRTCARIGLSEKEVHSRMKAQFDIMKKLKRADYSIQNNGSLEDLESKVRFLYTIFQTISSEGKRV